MKGLAIDFVSTVEHTHTLIPPFHYEPGARNIIFLGGLPHNSSLEPLWPQFRRRDEKVLKLLECKFRQYILLLLFRKKMVCSVLLNADLANTNLLEM